MSANLQILVDSFSEGVLIISPEGVVRLANQSAVTMFGTCLGLPMPSEEIRVQISSIARGYIRLPMEFDMSAPAKGGKSDQLRLKFMDSPVGGGYMVLVRNVSEAARYETIISNFANLLEIELGAPMQEFSLRLGGLLAKAVPDVPARTALTDELRAVLHTGEALVGRVSQLATFAQVFAKSPIFASDRIPVGDLVNALMARVRGLLEQRKIKLQIDLGNQELPVIYGSQEWLVEALHGYIEHMLKNCGVRSDLQMLVRPYGNFLSLQIRNHGRALPRVDDGKPSLPFGSASTKPGEGSLGLGMALCEHVVALHRGRMKFTDEDGDITALVLELPAGAPPETINPSLGAEQARRYAEDLTRLMQRQRQAKAN